MTDAFTTRPIMVYTMPQGRSNVICGVTILARLRFTSVAGEFSNPRVEHNPRAFPLLRREPRGGRAGEPAGLKDLVMGRLTGFRDTFVVNLGEIRMFPEDIPC